MLIPFSLDQNQQIENLALFCNRNIFKVNWFKHIIFTINKLSSNLIASSHLGHSASDFLASMVASPGEMTGARVSIVANCRTVV
jgi:hypothetical protein